MIKESKLKNKSRKIVKKYRKNKNNLKHKKTIKNGRQNKEKYSANLQKGGEVNSLSDFDFSQISVSKYINTQVDWGASPGVPPQPSCEIL